MAKKEVIQVIDDLDGAALDEYETIEWSLDGKSYEFDIRQCTVWSSALRRILRAKKQVLDTLSE